MFLMEIAFKTLYAMRNNCNKYEYKQKTSRFYTRKKFDTLRKM